MNLRAFCKGTTYVDIREFYGDVGDEKPGKKGISLSVEQVRSIDLAFLALMHILTLHRLSVADTRSECPTRRCDGEASQIRNFPKSSSQSHSGNPEISKLPLSCNILKLHSCVLICKIYPYRSRAGVCSILSTINIMLSLRLPDALLRNPCPTTLGPRQQSCEHKPGDP